MIPLSAQQTVDRAKAALQSGAAAGLPELLSVLESLSTDYLKVNLDELSVLIEKDGAVLAKVLAAANTLAHNPTIAPVATITQAIHLVGFQRIRSLTVSLMLLENTGGPRNPPEQREAAAAALCAGLFAQSCAEQLGSVDPDIAFAAATLRHFGYILFPAISLEHTREVAERLKTKPHDIAYRGMFGLTPIELSRRVLSAARLPEEVAATLREFDPDRPGGVSSKFETRLTAVAELGSRLAKHALTPCDVSETFLGQARLTARKFDRLLPDACELVEPALLKTDESLQNFLSTTGGTIPTPCLARIREHVTGVTAPAEAAAAVAADATVTAAAPTIEPPIATTSSDAALAPTAAAPIGAASASPRPIAAASIAPPAPVTPPAPAASWDDDLKNSGAFATARSESPEIDLASALGLARDALQAEECWLFQRLDGGASFSLVGGTGKIWLEAQPFAALRPEDRNVFGVALSRQEVVVLHDTKDPAITRYLPSWWAVAANMPRAFALVPIRTEQGLVGLSLIGWRDARKVEVSNQQVGVVQQLCVQAIASPSRETASHAA